MHHSKRPRCGHISRWTGKPCQATAGLCQWHKNKVPPPVRERMFRWWGPGTRTPEEVAEIRLRALQRIHRERAREKERIAEVKAAAERHVAWVRAPKVIRMRGGAGW